MSPYRILVRPKGGGNRRLLVAMLSKDKKTRNNNIYIVEKTLPPMWKPTPQEIKILAHKTTGKRNSTILDKYSLHTDDVGTRYIVAHTVNEFRELPSREFTQQDCLISAMNDYLEHKDLVFIQQV